MFVYMCSNISASSEHVDLFTIYVDCGEREAATSVSISYNKQEADVVIFVHREICHSERRSERFVKKQRCLCKPQSVADFSLS